MALGLYLSIPFCRTKCSYCNFASGVYSQSIYDRYLDQVASDVRRAELTARDMGGQFDENVDSIYLGGGTPTILQSHQLARLLVTISQKFCLLPGSEVTVECAPGTLTPALVETFLRFGVNRISLGVQSFVDEEAASVGRLHRRVHVREELAALRAAGMSNINIDLLAGLPHQTAQSWEFSLAEAVASGVPHISVYMLEVDEQSRLGRELIAGGTRYHAHFVPDEDLTADLYLAAAERLNAAGLLQYEISNFSRPGLESRHNLKYWTRQPYLGFGVDAHSMLSASADSSQVMKTSDPASERDRRPTTLQEYWPTDREAVRFSTPDTVDSYLRGAGLERQLVSRRQALEEAFFLGLRLRQGVDVEQLDTEFGRDQTATFSAEIEELGRLGLLERAGKFLRLTERGRLLSNDVFERFISSPQDKPSGRPSCRHQPFREARFRPAGV